MNSQLDSSFKAFLARLPAALFVLAVGMIIIPVVLVVFRFLLQRLKLSPALAGYLRQIVSSILYLLLFIALLYSLGLTGIAATLSGGVIIFSLAFSQAFKDLLQDMIAGFNIARDRDFEIGYTVQVGTTKGVIARVGARKVRIIDTKGYTRVLPNSIVEKSEWIVLNRKTKIATTKRKT